MTAMMSATPRSRGESLRFEPTCSGAGAVGSRRMEACERHESAGARHGGDDNERPGCVPISKRDRARESSDAKDERERQGDRAIGADAAVTHDLKLARAISAAAEAVRDVRKPVLVQERRSPR